MTPAAPASAKPPPQKTARRASASARTAPRRRRKLPGSPRGPVPRRVSGPVAAPAVQTRAAPAVQPKPAPKPKPAVQPRPTPAERRRRAARKQTLSERLAAFLRLLPDHPLLDRVVRGRAWIPLLGVMLVGIVAMQVELLKLNASTGRSIELIGSLQGRNDSLRAQVASASDPNRIERLAGRMGMTMPSPTSISFVRARSASVRRALAGIRVPNVAAFEAALRASNAATVLPAASPPQTSAPSNGAAQGTNTSSTASGAQTNSPAQTTSNSAAQTTSNSPAQTTNNSTAQTTSTTTAPVPTSSTGASTSAASPPATTAP